MNRGGTERLHMKSRDRNGRSSGGGVDLNMDFQAAIVAPGDLVLTRNVNNPAPHYPGVVVNPEVGVPDRVRRHRQDGKILVMFYGPPYNKAWPRDYSWVFEEDVFPLADSPGHLKDVLKDSRISKKDPYMQAVLEAHEVQIGRRDWFTPAFDEFAGADHRGRHGQGHHHEASHGAGNMYGQYGQAHPHGRSAQAASHGIPQQGYGQGAYGQAPKNVAQPPPQRAMGCTGCNRRLNAWEAQNRAKMGGRCADCQDLFEDGKYCPACEGVWFPTDTDMVECDGCGFWVHFSCDRLASEAGQAEDEVSYLCPRCRENQDVSVKVQKLQKLEQQLSEFQMERPREPIQIFWEDAQREYRREAVKWEAKGTLREKVEELWNDLSPGERAKYNKAARSEAQRHEQELREYKTIEKKAQTLREDLEDLGVKLPPGITASRQPLRASQQYGSLGSGSYRSREAPPSRGSSGGWTPTVPKEAPLLTLSVKSEPPGTKRKRDMDDDDEDYEEDSPRSAPAKKHAPTPKTSSSHKAPAKSSAAPQHVMTADDVGDLEVPVFCNGYTGIFLVGKQRIVCECDSCARRAPAQREHSCTQFEVHCGAGAAKKWKASIRIRPGAFTDVPASGTGMPIGKWMDIRGIDLRPPGVRERAELRAKAAPPPPPPKPAKEEKPPPPPWEPWMEMHRANFKPVLVRFAGDRCSVCDNDVDYDNDQLISCDQCGITVHQSCYGVVDLPGEDELWLCRTCEFAEEGGPAPQCCLCPVQGGALKPTDIPDLWCHAACLQWIPEVSVNDPARMEPITNIQGIQKERWELTCCLCKQKVGAKIQCTSCYAAYHPLCARAAGLHMEIVDGNDGVDGPVRPISYCAKHCTPQPELSGVQLVKPGDKPDGKDALPNDADANGLWNAQPFRHPPAVPIPDCPAGCARAQPLVDLKRASHGTGVGKTSVAGFWIPEKPATPPPEEVAEAKPGPLQKALKGFGGGRSKRGGRRGGPGRPNKDALLLQTARDDGNRDVTPPTGPVQAVQLMLLPDNTPEEIAVVCGGKYGILQVRSQKVLHNGHKMSASKFEVICGKGDAKKWKTSLWLVDDHGSQIMMVNDWLNERKLDRKALTALANNISAVEEYHQHVAYEVAVVVDDLVAQLAGEPPRERAIKKVKVVKPMSFSCTTDNGAERDVKHEPQPTPEVSISSAQGDRRDESSPSAVSIGLPDKVPPSGFPPTDQEDSGNCLRDCPQDTQCPPGQPPVVDPTGPLPGVPGPSGPFALFHLPGLNGEAASGQRDRPGTARSEGLLEGSAADRWADGVLSGPPGESLSGDAGGVQNPLGLPSDALQLRDGDMDADSYDALGENLFSSAVDDDPHDRAMEVELGTGADSLGIATLLSGRADADHRDPFADLDREDSYGAEARIGADGAYTPPTTSAFKGPEDGQMGFGGVEAWNAGTGASGTFTRTCDDRGWPNSYRMPASSDPTLLDTGLERLPGEGAQPNEATISASAAGEEPKQETEAEVTLVAQRPRVRVYFPEDLDWYEAVVLAHDPRTRRSKLSFFYDGEEAWMDLAEEEWKKCLVWVKPNEPIVPSGKEADGVPGAPPSLPPPPPPPIPIMRSRPVSLRAPTASDAVGWILDVWWDDDKEYYSAEVVSYNSKTGEHRLRYLMDDVEEDLKLDNEKVKWKKAPPGQQTSLASAGPASEGALVGPARPIGDVPPFVPVVCGDQLGTFDVGRMCIRLKDGREVSPTEFERLAGKAASKKWKASIRIDKGGGKPGQTMGDWLVDKGLDQPRAPRAKTDSLDAVRKRHAINFRTSVPGALGPKPAGEAGGGGAGRLGHRDGCMCVICKQARRTGKPWAGMPGGGGNIWLPGLEPPQRPKGSGPPPRFGKRAFVKATPQIINAPMRVPLSKLPAVKVIQGEAELEAMFAARREEASLAPAADADSAGAELAIVPRTTVKKLERKLNLKERLELCVATERQRLTFGKSGIHGWGLFAMVDMKQDSMVAEYRGSLLRPTVANIQEKRYRAEGTDCYLFTISDKWVIDATMCGTIARFTNHCCSPSMYTKPVEVDGEPRLVFFAKTDIKAGQELTYDYRFKEEEGDNKLPCLCGAPNCRGFMN